MNPSCHARDQPWLFYDKDSFLLFFLPIKHTINIFILERIMRNEKF